jgi:glc operon protein GlcG
MGRRAQIGRENGAVRGMGRSRRAASQKDDRTMAYRDKASKYPAEYHHGAAAYQSTRRILLARVFLLAGSMALLTGLASVTANAAAAAVTETIKVINHDGAQAVLQAATDAAKRLNAPCAIAVVDQSGVLMAFDRMDDVRAGSPDLAIGKARAAALLQRPTSEIEDNTDQGRAAFVTAGFLSLRGGVPLSAGQQVVGAVGVAGLNKDNDVKIATEAAEAFAKSAAGDKTP